MGRGRGEPTGRPHRVVESQVALLLPTLCHLHSRESSVAPRNTLGPPAGRGAV